MYIPHYTILPKYVDRITDKGAIYWEQLLAK